MLKALYLLQHVSWIAVTADTLAHALLRNMRAENLNALRETVQDSLERLRAARYVVPKEDGVWEFLTGSKKSFEEEVAGVTVRQSDLRREANGELSLGFDDTYIASRWAPWRQPSRTVGACCIEGTRRRA